MNEREDDCRKKGIHTEAHKIQNGDVSWLMKEVKRGIVQHKVLEANGATVMWRVLKTVTDNKLKNNTRIIIENGRACASQR